MRCSFPHTARWAHGLSTSGRNLGFSADRPLWYQLSVAAFWLDWTCLGPLEGPALHFRTWVWLAGGANTAILALALALFQVTPSSRFPLPATNIGPNLLFCKDAQPAVCTGDPSGSSQPQILARTREAMRYTPHGLRAGSLLKTALVSIRSSDRPRAEGGVRPGPVETAEKS
jgi:hypothetical protein